MLAHEDNEPLCLIEGDVPMGKIMRGHWMPACLAEEVPEIDGKPIRVRLLGEVLGKNLRMNVSFAIPALLLGVGFAVQSLKGASILARMAGLLANFCEEAKKPIGFHMAYAAEEAVRFEK